jgi:hypothetical protein
MSTYCAPCLADLALLRESVTTVSGTAACVAHAVLLLHPGDTAQQRLARLSELRSTAEGKIATASADDIPSLELLVQEYALAGAMDMTVPLRDLAGDRTPRPEGAAKKRRNRGRDRDRGQRPERVDGGAAPEVSSDAVDATPAASAPTEQPASSGEQTSAAEAPAASAPAEQPSAPVEQTSAPAEASSASGEGSQD